MLDGKKSQRLADGKHGLSAASNECKHDINEGRKLGIKLACPCWLGSGHK